MNPSTSTPESGFVVTDNRRFVRDQDTGEFRVRDEVDEGVMSSSQRADPVRTSVPKERTKAPRRLEERVLRGLITLVTTILHIALLVTVPVISANYFVGGIDTLAPPLAEATLNPEADASGAILDLVLWVLTFFGTGWAVLWGGLGLRKWLAEDDERSEGKAAAENTSTTTQALLNDRWSKALALHDQLDARWHGYETDLDAILARPLMRNLQDSAVVEAVRARAEASNLREERAPQLKPGQQVSDVAAYLNAVSHYEVSLDTAEQKAEIDEASGFSESERKDIETARRLLALALDTHAVESERQNAYARVMKILQGLKKISVPQEALELLAITHGDITHRMLDAT